MPNFLVFAGTTEGRQLVEYLNRCEGVSLYASVATEYGRSLLPKGVEVSAERLDAEKMTSLLRALRFDCVIDATHPYATDATENIRASCAAAETRYLRLLRPAGKTDGCVFVENSERAVEVLAATTGRVLLTTGCKELDAFARLPNFQERLYPRVLPTIESVQRCLALGFREQNIIAMQGPFSREMNGAILRQVGASIMVTKESGNPGGFTEKLGAAHDSGAIVIVIGRPREEDGLPFAEAVELLTTTFSLKPQPEKQLTAPRFPLFVELANRQAVLFGGGRAAAKRAALLLPFCRELTIIAPHPCPELETFGAKMIRRAYMQGDCIGQDLVVAATENIEIDHAICEEARSAGIPINAEDLPKESDFFLPAIARRGEVVIGVAAGTDEKTACTIAMKINGKMDEFVPEEEIRNGDSV